MEMIIDFNYDQVWKLVKQLPNKEKRRLNSEIEKVLNKTDRQSKKQNVKNNTKDQLRLGPITSRLVGSLKGAQFDEEDYKNYLERKHL
jgi:hypothetical protein